MPRAKKKNNQMDHMVQLGKVGSLMQASIQLNKLILKEKRVLKQIEQLRLVKDIKNSDIISIHLVLGERYKNLITKKEIEMMKKTSFLINTSRGPIINENDLVEALKDEKIAGVGLDVYDKEPLPQDHKLRFLPNALLLPHIGYVTAENYSKFYSQMIENLESCLENKPLRIIS